MNFRVLASVPPSHVLLCVVTNNHSAIRECNVHLNHIVGDNTNGVHFMLETNFDKVPEPITNFPGDII